MRGDEFTDIRKLNEFPEDFRAAYPREDVILRNRAECPGCGDVVESTHRHDFRSCGCGGISVDGGTAYLRRLWNLGILGGNEPIERSETRPQNDQEYEAYLNEMWDFMGPPGGTRRRAFLSDEERLNALVGPGSPADEAVRARNVTRSAEETREIERQLREMSNKFSDAADVFRTVAEQMERREDD